MTFPVLCLRCAGKGFVLIARVGYACPLCRRRGKLSLPALCRVLGPRFDPYEVELVLRSGGMRHCPGRAEELLDALLRVFPEAIDARAR